MQSLDNYYMSFEEQISNLIYEYMDDDYGIPLKDFIEQEIPYDFKDDNGCIIWPKGTSLKTFMHHFA